MKSELNSQSNVSNDNAATLSGTEYTYGVTSSNPAVRVQAGDAGYISLAEQFKIFSCEYILGILFVVCSLLFVLLIPASMTKPERVKMVLGRLSKRALDIIGALVGLVLSLPLYIILPILIKLDSPGPVFYTQVRVGENRRKKDRRYYQKSDATESRARDRRRENTMGRTFNVIKFRTMIQDAEKKCGPVWATENDPRITKLGRFLRKTRLDEFPQFFNVLIGDMSLVGPRPERPNFVADLSTRVDNYTSRLEVKPGLTGLAQVETGYDSDIDSVTRKVNLDLKYINNWSLWNDIKIIFKTVVVVFTGKGAC